MPAFATVEDLATYLPKTLPAPDSATASQAIDIATQMIKDYTGQTLEAVNNRVETFFAMRGRWLLKQLPVRAVDSITVDGTAFTDYIIDLDDGIIARSDETWLSTDVVVVQYDSGFTVIPFTIKGVCLRWATNLIGNPGGVQSEGIGNYSATWPDVAQDLKVLDRYRA